MQIEDGVGDNAGCALLVPARGHHQDGYIVGSDHPENHFIPLHNALWEDSGKVSSDRPEYQYKSSPALNCCLAHRLQT